MSSPRAAAAPVNPSDRVHLLVCWASLQLFACLSQVPLLVLSLHVPRVRRNVFLLNLHVVFLVSCGMQAMLIWTGHATDNAPPFGLCLFNASVVLASVPCQAGAALALVTKVWTSALLISYPDATFISWLSKTSLLLGLPYILSVPIFWASLSIGLGDSALVYRGSIFYCVLDNNPISLLTTTIGVSCMVICLVFAGWIATLVAHRAWRVRFARSSRQINLALVTRTLIYSLCAVIAIVVGVISAFTSFAETMPDMVLAVTGPAVFFIFASDKDILRLLCCAVRSKEPGDTSPGNFTPPCMELNTVRARSPLSPPPIATMTSMTDEAHAGGSNENRATMRSFDIEEERRGKEHNETSDSAMPVGSTVNKSPNR